MKNLIRKRRKTQDSANLSSVIKSKDDKFGFLYNLTSVAIIIEVLVGAILGITLCFGFFFAFFVLRGSLVVSFGIFLIILIIATFFVLALKYMFVLILLKLREIGLLEKIARK